MCTGAEIAGLVIAGGGAYMQQQQAEDTANQQQKIINQAQDEQSRLNTKKADTITNFATETFNPTTRDQNYEKSATKNESLLKDALLSANGGEDGKVYAGTEGNVSNDYLRGKAKATADATQDILNRTKLLSRSNAVGNMYNDESLKGSQLASDILGINAAGRRTANAAKAGLSNVKNNGSVLGGLLMAGSGAVPGIIKNNTWGGV